MCSFDMAAGYTQGYYAVCPFDERVCGLNRVITVEPFGKEQTVTSVGNSRSSDFIFGQICSYEVVWPEQAQDGDHFIVGATSVALGAIVSAIFGEEKINSKEFLREANLTEGVKLKVKYPLTAVITARAADTSENSDFSLSVTYGKGEGSSRSGIVNQNEETDVKD